MSIYKEKPDKLNLNVSGSNNEVKMSVDCYNGTVAKVSVDTGRIIVIGCDETKTIGNSAELEGKTLEFEGSANNPEGNQVKAKFTVFKVDGNRITYVFPDDYTGTPPYENSNPNPSFTFFVNFL